MARRKVCNFVFCGMTIVEIIISVSIMAILFAVILPQFRNMYHSWDSQSQRGEIVQNARVLIDCLSQSLASAIRVTSVSAPDNTLGYIEFEKNGGNTYRIDISGENYIRYGPLGNLSDFAGPVSQLQFQCYGLEDMSTTTTEPDEIRLVKVSTVIYNPEEPSRTQAYRNNVFIETNAGAASHLLAWYKFDEDAGLIASDSSIYNRDGQLNNMSGAEWADGYVGGGLRFDGVDDYVSFDIEWESESATLMAWACLDSSGEAVELINICNILGIRLDLESWTMGSQAYFYTGDNSWEVLNGNDPLYSGTGWHHFAYVIDSENNKHDIYVDGWLEMSLALQNSFVFDPPPTTNSHIGQHAITDEYEFYFDGIIDDVRIYDIALSPEEIWAIGPPKPIHYWALDDTGNTMTDSTGNMDGTCKGNVGIGELSFRDRFANCIYLNGKNGYVDLPSNGPLNALDVFSVCAWIKPEDTTWPAWIIGRNDNTCGWSFGVLGTSLVLEIWGKHSLEIPDVLTMDEWIHVAVCCDPETDYMTSFYVNGEFVGQLPSDNGPTNGNQQQNWIIGVCDKDGYFKGHIDEVKIFNYVLTEAQIKVTAGFNVTTDPYLDSEIRP